MLLNNLNLEVAKFASKAETKPEIAGVFITSKHTTATDGFRLVEMSVRSDVKPEDYPKVQGKSAMRGMKPVIVPAKELSKVKIPKNKDLPILENVAVSHVDGQRVDLMTTNLETADVKSFKRIEGKYPDYDQIFPKGEAKAEIEVNGKLLAEMLDTLSKLNNLNSVRIKFYKDNDPLVLEAKNDNQSARAMLMCLRK
jgi:DNA polymerase III sliding clamp (beta) subunit (PCNA family)